jgi:SAM-dependent methyltransferase
MTCQLCAGETDHWFDTPIDPKKNTPCPLPKVVMCRSCRVGQVEHLPDAAEIPAFYALDEYYTHGESHIRAGRPNMFERILEKVAYLWDAGRLFEPRDLAAFLPPKAIVYDLGCGPGVLLQKFAQMGCITTGVDPDAEARALGASRGIRILPGTGEALPNELEPGTADMVLMTHSLEHCLDPQAAIANARRLLKPGGLFYCEVPNCDSLHFQTFLDCSEMCDVPRHLFFFGPESLAHYVEAAGFSVIDRYFSGFERHHSVGWRDWEQTIFARARAATPTYRGKRHGYVPSVGLLMRTLRGLPERKYDCVGLLSRAE